MKSVTELQEELETIKMLHGDVHEQVAICLDQIGMACYANNENNRALEYFEKALNVLREIYSEEGINNSELSLDIQYRIGKVYEAKAALNSRFDNKGVYFQKVLSFRELFDSDPNNERDESRRSNEDMDSTLIYNDAAEEARFAGNVEAAEPLYLKSIQLRRKKFGKDHPALSPVLINYSELLKQKNQLEESLMVLEEALAINMKHHGRINGNVALVLNNIGQIHKYMNNLSLAESFLMESLTLRRELYGEINVHVAGSLNNLGELHREKLDFFKAIHYHKLAIEAFEKSVGISHPGTINAKGNYGITLRRYAITNSVEGESILKDTVEYLHQNEYEEHHPWLVKFTQEHMITQAQKLASQGKHDESLEIYDSVLKKKQNFDSMPVPQNNVSEVIVRPQSPAAETQDLYIIARGKFISMVGKAKSLLQKAKFKELDVILEECALFPRSQLGSDEICWIDYHIVLAQYKFMIADYSAANEIFVHALQGKIDVFGPDHLSLVEIMIGLAENYRAQAIYADAETFLTQAMKLVDIQYKQDVQNIGKATIATCLLYITAIVSMAEVHRNQGAYAVAAPLLQQAFDMSIENSLEEEQIQAELLTSIAALEKAKSNFEKAIELHNLALNIRVRVYGSSHPKALSSLFHLAEIEFLTGRYCVAEKRIEEVLQGRLIFFEEHENHPAVAATLHLKSALLLAQYKLDSACECLERVLAMKQLKFASGRRNEVLDKLLTREERAVQLFDPEVEEWSNHPTFASSFVLKGNFLKEKMFYEESIKMYETALRIYRNCFPSTPYHNGVCNVMARISCIFVAKFQYNAAIVQIEECIRVRTQYMNEIGVKYHLSMVELYAEYGHVLLQTGRHNDALLSIGQGGIHSYNTIKRSSLSTADCLFVLADYSRVKGKYKDAKYQYSLCMSLRFRELGASHPKVLQVLYGAADNMREVGYFHDALEAVRVLKAVSKNHYGEDSIFVAVATLLHANILCDRHKSIKAESAYASILPTIESIFGERSPYYLQIKLGLANCLLQEAKFTPAETIFKECLNLAQSLFSERSHVWLDTQSNIYFLRSNNKPAEQYNSCSALRDEIVPKYVENFGEKHPYTAHQKGRLAVAMNILKKDSGRKLLKDAKACFDDQKQFPYTCDHPWILELGGYEKSASKDRLSSNVEESALALWAMPAYEGDLSYGELPKHILIDLENNFPENWGQVHYFGISQTDLAPRPKSPAAFTALGVDVSPGRKNKKTITTLDTVSAVNVSADEIKARQTAEDNLVNEIHLRKEVEENLERIQLAKQDVDEKLALETAERRLLEEKMAAIIQELNEARAAKEAAESIAAAAQEAVEEFAAEKEALAALALKEAEEAMKLFKEPPSEVISSQLVAVENPDVAASSQSSNPLEVALDHNDQPPAEDKIAEQCDSVDTSRTVIVDRLVISALQAAEFLLSRAKELQNQGWYRKAQPLFEECMLVMETHVPLDPVTMDALFYYAMNLQYLTEFSKAELKFSICLAGRERLSSIRSESVAQIMIAQANNYMLQGRFAESTARFAEVSKLLVEITDSSTNSLYGECLCWQSLNALRLGKILESKAMNDRSNAILSKKTAINNVMITNGLLIKCDQLRINYKFKEAQNVLEQTLIYRKRVMGELHPAIADCLVLMGVCFLENGKPFQAEVKLQQAMNIRLTYFEQADYRIVEVQFYMAKLHMQFSRLYEAVELFNIVLKARQKLYLTSDHCDVAEVYLCLGDAFMKLGKYVEAEKNLKENLRIRLLNLPETLEHHPKIAEAKCKLGELNRLLGNYTEAKILLEESLEERKLIFGKEHPEYLISQQEYALVLMNCDDFTNAEKLMKKTLKHRLSYLGCDHPDYAYSQLCMCELFRLSNRMEEVDPLLIEATKTFKLLYQKDDFSQTTSNVDESKSDDTLLQSSLFLVDCQLLKLNLKLSELEIINNAAPEDHGDEDEPEEDVVAIENMGRSSENNTEDLKAFSDNQIRSDPANEDCHEEDDDEAENPVLLEILPTIPIPVFNNEKYVELVSQYQNLLELLQKNLIRPDADVVLHPLILYIEANIGVVKLYEYLAKNRFVERLSDAEREAFKQQESRMREKIKVIVQKPEGILIIEKKIDMLLSHFLLHLNHSWILKYRLIVNSVVFTLDDMELANNYFIEAEDLRKKCKFYEADMKYDTVFMTQIMYLGALSASTNIAIADTLYAKAENCRMMGMVELSNILYNQSITIYRKRSGNDSEGTIKGIIGLTELLVAQGLFEDAYAVHTRILTPMISLFGELSVEIGRLKTSLSKDLLGMFKYEKALAMANEALQLFDKLSYKDANDISTLHITFAYIYLGQGKFSCVQESLETAQMILAKANCDAEQISNIDLMQCKVEYLFTINKIQDAYKLSSKMIAYRIKIFGKSASELTGSSANSAKKTAFYDAFDTLSMESSRANDQLAASKTKSRKGAKSKQEEEDLKLEEVMSQSTSELHDDFKDQPNAALPANIVVENTDISEKDGPVSISKNTRSPQTYTSLSKFAKDGTSHVYFYKNRPVVSHPVIAQCLLLRGKIAIALFDLEEAKSVLEGAMNMMNQLYSKSSIHKLSTAFELANLILWKGKFEEAKQNHGNVLHQRFQLCEEDHPDKSDSLYTIATINLTLSRYDDSTQMLANSLLIRDKVFGDSHWKMAEVYSACAQVLHDKGLYAESNAMFDKAMFLLHKNFGDLHMLISNVLVGQAQNARELGIYEQATSYLEQAISMRSVLVGESHPLTAECHYHMAAIKRLQGRILEAKRCLDDAIVIQRDSLGKYHGTTLTTLLAMAFNFMDLAKFSTALHVFNRANQLLRKSLGKDHITVAEGYCGLAENYKHTGFYDKSLELHEKALYIRRKILGERHELVAESMFFIAEINFTFAKYDDAAKGFDDSLAIQKLALGENHLSVTNTMCALGKVLLAQGKIGDAKFQFERSLYIRKQMLNSDHPSIGDSQFLIAQISRKMGKVDQSTALFERCLNIVRDSRGSRHPLVATVLYNLAEVCNVSGRYVYAKELLLESLQIRLAVLRDINENHPDIAESFFGLAENLRYTGHFISIKPSEHEKFFSKKLSVTSTAELVPDDATSNSEANSKAELVNNKNEVLEHEVDELGEAILLGTVSSSLKDSIIIANTNSSISRDVVTSLDTIHTVQQPQPVQEDDDISAPTVEISAIEQLDSDSRMDNNTNNSNVVRTAVEERDLLEEMGLFKAMPLYEKVLDSLLLIYPTTHPLVIQTKFAIAEIHRVVGHYDVAFKMFEDILVARRALYGDTHPESVHSMLMLGEVLRNLQKIFPDTPSGSIQAKTIRQSKNAIPVGVSLVEHFSSLIRPNTAVNSVPFPVTHGDDTEEAPPGSAEYNRKLPTKKDPAWVFLSEPEVAKSKKEVIKIQKGYMGYQFPSGVKTKIKSTEDGQGGVGSMVVRPQKIMTNDAKWLFDFCLSIQKKLYGDGVDHPTTAGILYARGELYRARRDYALALKEFDKCLTMRRKIFRGSHPVIAEVLNSMAEIFRIEGKYNQAAPLFEKALEIRVEAYARQPHPSIADVKNNIAMLYFSQGKFAEAQSLMEEALTICEELLGAAHPSTAFCLNNMAGLMQATGQFKQAFEMFQQTLRIKRSVYGESHPDVASTLNNIGLLMKSENRNDEALQYYQKALEIQQKLYGVSHPDVATTMNNLAALYVTIGRRREAKEMYQNCITIRSSLFGIEHPSIAAVKNNFGTLLFALGELNEARDLFEDSLRIRRSNLGEDHPAIAESLNNIGLVLYAQGAWMEAVPLYERALQIKINAFGTSETPSVATSMNNLAALHHRLGNYDTAIEYYQKAYDIRLSTLGANHSDTKLTLSNLSSVEKDLQKARTKSGMKGGMKNGSFEESNSSDINHPFKDKEGFGEPSSSVLYDSSVIEELSTM